MIEKKDLAQLFPINFPIAKDGTFWNGMPDEFSNIGLMLDFSQEFGHTPYAKTGVYGTYNGKTRPHNGHDYASFLNVPLVTPCRVYLSYKGWDAGGYGWFCFLETESKTINGDTIKIEFVVAHMKDPMMLELGKWYDVGTFIQWMGSTGMSTNPHVHFGVRPLIRKSNGSWDWLFKDEEDMAARGYIDPNYLLIQKPVYDKQTLINKAKFMEDNEKKIIIEGTGVGRKGIIINGKLQEIKAGREGTAALYVLNNNGFGTTVSTADFNALPKDKDF